LKAELPRIYPITDTRLSGLSHAEQAERLIAGGARILQLREKHLSSRDFYALAVEVMKAADHGVVVIINDRIDIALTIKAGGVHLGQDDMPPEQARAILGPDAIIGFSTHTIEQVVEAAGLPVDYIAFGPIFGTRSKTAPAPVVGLAGLAKAREAAGKLPLVAIGGINESNLKEVFEAGADSAAMIGAIVSDAANITSRMGHFNTHFCK
jgi:thiamine-phosphate pyrophosphorylase